MTMHYLMISIIKGKSPTVLFSLSLTCHSKKNTTFSRLITYFNKFDKNMFISLNTYIQIPFATFAEDSRQDSYKILNLQ